jgi:hypothetical protein
MPEKTLPDIQTSDQAVQFLRYWKGTRATEVEGLTNDVTDAEKTRMMGQRSSKQENPFFLAVGFHKPHVPLKFPKHFLGDGLMIPLD